MSQSRQVQLRQAVAAVLVQALAVDGGVQENRDLVLPNGTNSQVHVNLLDSKPMNELLYTNSPRDWATEIEIAFLTRRVGADEASDLADALWVQAYQALMAEQTLGGRAWELLPGDANWEDGQGDSSLCRLTWMLTVHHRTTNNTLT